MSMQTTDPIADLLTRIRNAKLVGKTEVRVPSSKMKKVIAEQLVKNGYLITRISKPGRRVYVGASEIPKVKSGRGLVLISTSKGVMTGAEAAKAKLGGELLLKVY